MSIVGQNHGGTWFHNHSFIYLFICPYLFIYETYLTVQPRNDDPVCYFQLWPTSLYHLSSSSLMYLHKQNNNNDIGSN